MDFGIASETRREPIPGGSSPASLLVTVSEAIPNSIGKCSGINEKKSKLDANKM